MYLTDRQQRAIGVAVTASTVSVVAVLGYVALLATGGLL